MITICTHKKPDTLENCLKSFHDFKTVDHKILVCESSDDPASQEVANKYGAEYALSGYHYEFGTIHKTFELYPDEAEYYFLQDSIEVKAFDWERIFLIPSKGTKLVGLSTFPANHDHIDTIHARSWYEKVLGKPFPWDSKPVFGNMFYCPQSMKQKFIEKGALKFLPNEKLDSCAMERIISAILDPEDVTFCEEFTKSFWGWTCYINKIWHSRN